MLRKAIRSFLNRRGFEIIKKEYLGAPYPAKRINNELYYETPLGNYYLPLDAEKDGVANFMRRGRVHDPEVLEVAQRFIKPGTAALDVGANFGQMCVLFARMTGDNGKVYGFEAQDKVFYFLKKSIEASGHSNIVLKDGAVYNEDGKILIFPEPDYSKFDPYGSNSINPKMSSGGREVKTYTIDSLNIKEPITFMKVDIQGSDLFALKGAKQTIFKNKMAILFEFEQEFQEQFGTSFQDYVDFAAEINYKFVEIIAEKNFLIVPK